MKSFFHNSRAQQNCEGVSRRDVLKVGALSFLALSLPQFLSMQRAMAGEKALKDKNCILLFMNGGPSHIDTWDPKPEAPAEIRGEFGAIATNVEGIRVSEHLPNMARIADKYAIVRSFT